MLKIARIIYITVFTLAIVFKAQTLAAEYISAAYPLQFQYSNHQIWQYLRSGLNYLESPKPSLPPETVPVTYVHPDSRGYGAYGFSIEAYQDVQRLYPFFRGYSWQDVLDSQQLYELANQAFADWLLKNLQSDIPSGASDEQIFDVLHQAWNLGLTGFIKGRKVVASRIRRAEEFKRSQKRYLAQFKYKKMAGQLSPAKITKKFPRFISFSSLLFS